MCSGHAYVLDGGQQNMKFDADGRLRGIAKVVLVAVATNEILTAAFSAVARQIDPDVAPGTIMLFSFVTSMLAGCWLQADARRAYAVARKHGFIVKTSAPVPSVVIRDNCPKRWLVKLYLELNPSLTAL
jgi:hypothetical protein